MTAWSAKVSTRAIWAGVKGRTSQRDMVMVPIDWPARSSGTDSMVRWPPSFSWGIAASFGIGLDIKDVLDCAGGDGAARHRALDRRESAFKARSAM